MLLLMTILFCSCTAKHQPDSDCKRVISSILETKEMIEKIEGSDSLFVAFWDFDGTIIKGDCSEGLEIEGQEVFKGLARMCIDQGFSKIYEPGSYDRFFTEYRRLEEEVDTITSYTYMPRIFAGASVASISEFSKNYFDTVLKQFYFQSSIQILDALRKGGIDSYVISASADFFVKGASESVQIDSEKMVGIRLVYENGKLTDELIYPVTFSDGKTETMQQIVQQLREKTGKKVFVLAGFGDSYRTDGPFLLAIANQTLPAGKPYSIKINTKGDIPAQYKGKFIEVLHDKTVSGK